MSEVVLFLVGMIISIVAFCGSLMYAYVLLIGKEERDRVEDGANVQPKPAQL